MAYELIRLGFMRYVEALRLAGERLLFPELMPGLASKRKLGDVFLKFSNDYLERKRRGGEVETRFPSAASLARLKEVVEQIPIINDQLSDQHSVRFLPV